MILKSKVWLKSSLHLASSRIQSCMSTHTTFEQISTGDLKIKSLVEILIASCILTYSVISPSWWARASRGGLLQDFRWSKRSLQACYTLREGQNGLSRPPTRFTPSIYRPPTQFAQIKTHFPSLTCTLYGCLYKPFVGFSLVKTHSLRWSKRNMPALAGLLHTLQ